MLYSFTSLAEPSNIDVKTSNLWLLPTKLSQREEGTLTKLQDRNIHFVEQKCKPCPNTRITVDHLATYCPTLADKDYMRRHDEVARVVQHRLLRNYGLRPKKLKNHRVETIINAGHVTIKYDAPIITGTNIPNNRPDILVMDRRAKKALIVEIGITSINRLIEVENTKWRKYERLAAELRTLHSRYQTTCVPVVATYCPSLTDKDHMKRHDEIARVVQHRLMRNYSLKPENSKTIELRGSSMLVMSQ